jgi:hypothetical protein
MKELFNATANTQGYSSGSWILLDYGMRMNLLYLVCVCDSFRISTMSLSSFFQMSIEKQGLSRYVP